MSLNTTQAIDAGAGATTAALIFGYLVNYVSPVVVLTVGILGCVYYALHIFDHPVMQRWRDNRHQRWRIKRAHRLQQDQSRIVGELRQLGLLDHAEVKASAGTSTSTITSTVPAEPKSKP